MAPASGWIFTALHHENLFSGVFYGATPRVFFSGGFYGATPREFVLWWFLHTVPSKSGWDPMTALQSVPIKAGWDPMTGVQCEARL